MRVLDFLVGDYDSWLFTSPEPWGLKMKNRFLMPMIGIGLVGIVLAVPYLVAQPTAPTAQQQGVAKCPEGQKWVEINGWRRICLPSGIVGRFVCDQPQIPTHRIPLREILLQEKVLTDDCRPV